jgi:cryptochrome
MKQVLGLLGEPNRPLPSPDFVKMSFPLCNDFDDKYSLDTLEKFGTLFLLLFWRTFVMYCSSAGATECSEQKNPINKWLGGESRALELLQGRLRLEENAFKGGFLMPNQYRPDLLGPPLTLSPHLRFGCLSVRQFFWAIHDIFREVWKT